MDRKLQTVLRLFDIFLSPQVNRSSIITNKLYLFIHSVFIYSRNIDKNLQK